LTTDRLLIRSGMNYVVYWDIFRDYLVEGKVPTIPWARALEGDPGAAMRVVTALGSMPPATMTELAHALGRKKETLFYVLGDLMALEIVERTEADKFRLSPLVRDVSPVSIAESARRQLMRHIVYRELEANWERGARLTYADWATLFTRVQPRTANWSKKSIYVLAGKLRQWLVFAGLLEQ